MSFTLGTIWSKDKDSSKKIKISYPNKSNSIGMSSINNKFLFNRNSNFYSNNNKEKKLFTDYIAKQSKPMIKRPIAKKNMPWAVATWHLFHMIPAQISDENFEKYKSTILNFIKNCCLKLPCPYCKDHARVYLQYNNIFMIKTRSELEKFLYTFHNKAHRVEKFIPWEDCIPKYKTIDKEKVFSDFEIHFFQSFIGGRYFSDWIRNGFRNEYNSFKFLMLSILD